MIIALGLTIISFQSVNKQIKIKYNINIKNKLYCDRNFASSAYLSREYCSVLLKQHKQSLLNVAVTKNDVDKSRA